MEIYSVKVKYQLYDGGGATPTTSTITIKRKAASLGEAITMVTALINALSNVVYAEGDPVVRTPFLTILEAGHPSQVT